MPAPQSDYGYGGYCKIGSTAIMVTPGADLDRPRNINTPYPIGNRYGIVNGAEGARFPVVNIPAIVMASWFTAENLNAWLVTRGGSSPWDVGEVGGGNGIEFSDSAQEAHKINNPKPAGFTLNVRWGMNPLIFNMSFNGVDLGVPGEPPDPVSEEPLTYAAVSLGGGFADKGIVGITVNFNNQLTPNEGLNGLNKPWTHNADHPVGQVQIVQYSGGSGLNGVWPPGYTDRNNYTDVTDASLSVRIDDNKFTRFGFRRLVLMNPNARQTQAGRVFRRFQYQMFAGTGVDHWPMGISET